jgi:hypothetical protein
VLAVLAVLCFGRSDQIHAVNASSFIFSWAHDGYNPMVYTI